MPHVSAMRSERQRDWLRFIRDSAKNPPTELGADVAIDVGTTWDVVIGADWRPIVVLGVAALVQSIMLGLEVYPGTWWISDFGGSMERHLGSSASPGVLMEDVLRVLKAERRIVRGTEAVRVTDKGDNRQLVEVEFIPRGVQAPFVLYAPARRG